MPGALRSANFRVPERTQLTPIIHDVGVGMAVTHVV